MHSLSFVIHIRMGYIFAYMLIDDMIDDDDDDIICMQI